MATQFRYFRQSIRRDGIRGSRCRADLGPENNMTKEYYLTRLPLTRSGDWRNSIYKDLRSIINELSDYGGM